MFAARLHSFRKLTLSCQLCGKQTTLSMIYVCMPPTTKSLALTWWNPKRTACSVRWTSPYISRNMYSPKKITANLKDKWGLNPMSTWKKQMSDQDLDQTSTSDQDQIRCNQSTFNFCFFVSIPSPSLDMQCKRPHDKPFRLTWWPCNWQKDNFSSAISEARVWSLQNSPVHT